VFDLAVIILRWVQMTGAMILFGSSLFFLYALPKHGPASALEQRWARPLLLVSAATIFVGCVLGFLAQTIVLAGSIQDGLQLDALSAAITGMSFGKSSLVRAITAGLFIGVFALAVPGRRGWWIASLAGGLICMSFAWMGHGAATKGAAGLLHVSSDILHSLAASVWIGALVVFLILLVTDDRHSDTGGRAALHQALHAFSGIGSGLVAVLVATGLINSWFVVGRAGLPRLWTTTYGQLLTLKLVLFGVMVALAAANRFHLTPRLGAALCEKVSATGAMAALRGSLIWETGISITVLGLVAWFGMLAPPSVS
jgi:putative copper resistance protein D